MGARNKLNSANMNGALVIGAIAGLATGSVAIFLIVSGVLVATSLAAGDIRPKSTRRDRHDPRR